MLLEFQERMIIMVEDNYGNFAQKGDCLWITHFKYRSLHKYIVARGEDRLFRD